MDLELKGKVAVVMAASKGLGKATAMELSTEGAVVIISSRSLENAQQTCEEIKKETGNEHVYGYACDMRSPEAITELFRTVADQFGRVDILINNTGGPKPGGFEKVEEADWQAAFEQNLLSYIRTTQAVLPLMKEQQFGRIVQITSSSVKEVIDGLILSNTFRAGIVGLTKSLAREMAAYNILVNAVGPGKIATGRVAEIDQATADREGISVVDVIERSQASIPRKRYGSPEEFAKIVVFLASNANTYMTGQSLVVDGGMLKAL